MNGAVPTRSLSEQWIASMLLVIRDARSRSEGAAALYYGLERYEQAPDLPTFPGAAADELEDEAVLVALDAAGRKAVERALEDSKRTLPEALELGGTGVAGSADRISLNGGRTYWLNAHREDRYSLAYFRNPRAGCCSFCAMLASRGAVYREDSFDSSDPRFFGPGNAKVHDSCHCTIGSIWRQESSTVVLPAFGAQMGTLWEQATKGLSGKAAQNAFRNAYEASFGRRD